jgi:surface polysaccharide O-acyltransferase-like enzyme
MKAQRLIYADLLRVIATFVIVILHVSGSSWHNVPVSGFEWKVFNFYDSMARFSVPVFVMISGMFLLDNKKSLTLKKLYSKNILRIVTSFIFWYCYYWIKGNCREAMFLKNCNKEIMYKIYSK